MGALRHAEAAQSRPVATGGCHEFEEAYVGDAG